MGNGEDGRTHPNVPPLPALSAAPRQRFGAVRTAGALEKFLRARRPANYTNDVANIWELEPKICFNWSSEIFSSRDFAQSGRGTPI